MSESKNHQPQPGRPNINYERMHDYKGRATDAIAAARAALDEAEAHLAKAGPTGPGSGAGVSQSRWWDIRRAAKQAAEAASAAEQAAAEAVHSDW